MVRELRPWLGWVCVLMGVLACGQRVEPPAPAAVDTKAQALAPVGQVIWLKACANGLHVSADLNRGAALVADRASAQGWEQFEVVDGGGGYIGLRARANNLFVSADLNRGAALVADRGALEDWERFQWEDRGAGRVALRAKANGLYVSADLNRGATLVADRQAAQCWEEFSWGTSGTGGGGGGTWVEVWRDDFEGGSPNPQHWRYNTTIHVNNEQQRYTDSTRNVQVGSGTLKLIARYEPSTQDARPFTSGRLESQHLKEFLYGRFEARIRLPVADGMWPAFWMLGNNEAQVRWPNCGEIDIMENVGYADWVSGSVHGPEYSSGNSIVRRFSPASSVANWHVYRVDWSPTEVRWFVDEAEVFVVTRASVEQSGRTWVFDHPFYIILNLAVGGDYPKGVNGVTSPYWGVPQSTVDLLSGPTPPPMEVDWVKVYQRQ